MIPCNKSSLFLKPTFESEYFLLPSQEESANFHKRYCFCVLQTCRLVPFTILPLISQYISTLAFSFKIDQASGGLSRTLARRCIIKFYLLCICIHIYDYNHSGNFKFNLRFNVSHFLPNEEKSIRYTCSIYVFIYGCNARMNLLIGF